MFISLVTIAATRRNAVVEAGVGLRLIAIVTGLFTGLHMTIAAGGSDAIVQAATVENVLAGNWPVTDRCALVMIPSSRSIMIDSVEDLILVRALAEKFIAENYPEC